MVSVRELLYLVIGAKDIDAWAKFAVDCIGMTVSERQDDRIYLRMDERVSRICVVQSDDEDVHALGWLVASEDELIGFATQLDTSGTPYELIEGDEAKSRKVLKFIRLRDPNGIVHEVAWGTEINDRTFFRSAVVKDGFKAGALGLGHIALAVDNLDASSRFYKDVLGHKVSTHLFVFGQQAVFLRCNARHHSVALAVSGRAKRLQHMQVEYNEFDDLMRAHDRVEDQQVPVIATLGKHNSDWVTSFYIRAPSEVTLEMAYGARLLNDDDPTECENFSGSIWGHRKGMENA